MLYIPFPFKRCTKCKNDYLPTLKFFPPNKRAKDGLDYWCKNCYSRSAGRWKKNNPDKVQESRLKGRDKKRKADKRYYETHREIAYQQSLIRRKGNPDKWREYQERYQNKPETKEKKRLYDQIHEDEIREYRKSWRRNNRDKRRAANLRREAIKLQLPATFTDTDWRMALDYFDERCAVCGRPQGLWHKIAADHWIPLTAPDCPGTVPMNIVPLCHGKSGCNNSKHDRDPVEWLNWKFGERKAKVILNAIQDYFDKLR